MAANDTPTDTENQSFLNDNADDAGAQHDFLAVIKNSERVNEQFLGALQRKSWGQSLRAYRNQHPIGTKYETTPYRNRSKIFRPKIRTALRKNMAAAAGALFSTADVVSITAEYDNDEIKQASAGVLQEVLNYRLDRTATKSGIPWFLTAMGACLDSQIHAVSCSKQYWEHEITVEESDVKLIEDVEEPAVDPETGQMMFDEMGAPMVNVRQEERMEVEHNEFVVRDRPMIMNIPPENVEIDPAAPWFDPFQLSGYASVKFPMTFDDVKTMLANPGKKGAPTAWLEIPDSVLQQAVSDFSSKGVRIERAGGVDRYDNRDNSGPNADQQVIWMRENFVRVRGADYHFWTVGTRAYASKVRFTREAYPEQFGARPYVYGYGAIEPHNISPMSIAESIVPLQTEANDLVNLRLDTAKQALSPIAVVRQGTVFDWKQLQHRGAADSTIIVKQMDDLRFEKTPSPDASSYQEMNLLSVDMDDLSGSFSNSSVQSNRQLNETVGGMRMLSGNANSVTEFDLRVWVETWVEPVLRQVVRTIQYYEDDQTILDLAGSRAKLFERYGVNAITDKDLETEVSVKVNVGIGSADPMQKLQKLGMALSAILNVAPLMDKKPTLNGEQIAKEFLGNAGYNDGMRFISFDTPEDSGPPPEVQLKMMEMQAKQQIAEMQTQMQMAIAKGKDATTIANTKLAGIMSIVEMLLGQRADMEQIQVQDKQAKANQATSTLADLFKHRTTESNKMLSMHEGLKAKAAESKERQKQQKASAA